MFSPLGHVFVSWLDDTSAFVSLKEKEMAVQVLEVLKAGTSNYRIQSYQSYAAEKLLSSQTPVQSCGITPTLEKLPFLPANGTEGKKRPISPEQAAIKRHKSVSDDNEVLKETKKTFDEPEWE